MPVLVKMHLIARDGVLPMHEQHARRDTVKMLHKVGAEDLGSVEDQEEDQGAEGAEDAEDQEDADIKYKYNI